METAARPTTTILRPTILRPAVRRPRPAVHQLRPAVRRPRPAAPPIPGGALRAPVAGTTTSVCDGVTMVGGTVALIDDMEHPDEKAIPEVDGRSGHWFTSNDGTLGAMMTPSGENPYPTMGVGYTGYGFQASGSGFEGWGANFGLNLNEGGGRSCGYDASAFDGIEFWAKTGDDSTQSLSVAIAIAAVIPEDKGGTCIGEGCTDAHSKEITVTGTWTKFEVRWDTNPVDLSQNDGWVHDNKFDFDPASISQISFNVPGNADAPVSFDFIIDDLSFIGGNPSMGGSDSGS